MVSNNEVILLGDLKYFVGYPTLTRVTERSKSVGEEMPKTPVCTNMRLQTSE